MVRRIVEEDVATPTTTVVDNDGSWIGRTIVALVVITLLVIGAIWLIRAVSNNDNGSGTPNVNITQNDQPNNNDTNPDTNNSAPAPQPS